MALESSHHGKEVVHISKSSDVTSGGARRG